MSDITIAEFEDLDPAHCDCFAKNLDPATCDCACHLPTRDNTVTPDDLELDRLKAERDALAKSERAKSDLLKHLAEIAECEPEAERLELRISMLMAVFGAVEIAPVERITVERDELKAQVQGLEYELKDKRGQFDDANRCADRFITEHHAAVEHLDEFTGLGLVEGIKAMRVALITARAELAATKAGADHLQTSLTRALADLAAQDRALTATANELRAERDGARGELARVRATVLEELAKLGVVR